MAKRGRSPGRAQGVAGTWPPHGGVHTGGFTAGFGAWTGVLEKLRELVRAEAGAGRLLRWVPIAFGTGIAFYFAADHEPVLPVAVVTALGLGVVAFLLRRGRFFVGAVMAAGVAAGFATATWRTAHIAHEVLARPAYSVSLSGFVEARDIRERTDRFVLRVTQMDGPALGAQGCSTCGGKLRRIQSPLAAAARSLAAGQLRLWPRPVLSGHRSLGLCHRRHQGPRPAGRRRLFAALRRLHAGPGRWYRRADTRHAGRRQARDRYRAFDRAARRDHDACQRCDVHLRSRPRAFDLRLSDRALSQGGSGSITVHSFRRDSSSFHVTNHVTMDQNRSRLCFPGTSQPIFEVLPMPALQSAEIVKIPQQFSDAFIRRLKPAAGETDRLYWDPEMPGFGVRVRSTKTVY